MRIAIEGCAHGELERIYDTIKYIEKEENTKVDLLICCGDFQSTRNMEDLKTMAVPEKYQDICTFYKYYSGELVAPVLTIFIGGNHEASNYLQELPFGGWVAPNIYYLGYAGVVRVNGLRIAGLSGIYKGNDYLAGHHEFSPYSESTKRSVYHIRQLEVFRLMQLSGRIDICLSHDWPLGIYNYGDKNDLLERKPFFQRDIECDQLGSKPCKELLMALKPDYWFSAHLHCKFAALVPHNEDETSDAVESRKYTKFLALDKCLPKRNFLQILNIETDKVYDELGSIKLAYDPEWLSILKVTNHLLSIKKAPNYMPGPDSSNQRYNFTPTEDELQDINTIVDDFTIPANFCRTAAAFEPQNPNNDYAEQPKPKINPQTQLFCDMLGIDDPTNLAVMFSGGELESCDSRNDTLDTTTDVSSSNLTNSHDDSRNTSNADELLSTSNTSQSATRSIIQLKLPDPTNKSSDLLDSEDVKTQEIPPLAYAGCTEEEVAADAESVPSKTFKRRNQKIYKNDDSNSDE